MRIKWHYSYIALPIALLLVSWFNFFQAAVNANFIYQPLRSFFQAIELESSSKFFNSASWFLAHNHIKPELALKISHELGMWLTIIITAFAFIKSVYNKDLIEDQEKVFKLSLFSAFLFCFLLPNDSSDLFGYIARGAQQFSYASNPFHNVIADLSNWRADQLLANFLWQHNPSPYGPFSMLICKFVSALSFGNLFLAIFLFKFLNFTAFTLILLIAQKITSDKFLFAILALNPIILFESIWNSHNDIQMGLAIILALYYCQEKRYNLSIVLLCLGALIKYLSLVLIPFVLIDAIKNRKIPFLGIISSAAITGFLVYYYDLFNSNFTKLKANITLSHKSLFDSLNSLYKYLSAEDLPGVFRYIFLAAFIGFALWFYYLYSKKQNTSLMRDSSILLFVLIFIASPKFHSWYLISLLPLGILSYPRLAFYFSITHLLSFTFLDQANIANFALMTLAPSVLWFKSQRHRDMLQT